MARKFRMLLSIFIIMTLSSVAFAEEDGAGCGVGKMVMEGKSGKNANLSASLINMAINFIVPQQLFGMTTGTLGCDTTQQVSNEYERESFFAKNEDNLSIEIARGEGEHLTSLASIMGIHSQDQSVFFTTLQGNFETIITANDMLASIDSTMLDTPQLEKYVR